MKKTLITLLALCGVAAADTDLTLSTGISYNDTLYNGYTNPNVEGLDYTYGEWPGSVTTALTFTIDISNLFNADKIDATDLITLNTLTVKVHSGGWALDGNRAITLSIADKGEEYTYSQAIANNGDYVVRDGDELTLLNIGWENLTKDTKITFTIDGGSDHTVALAGSTVGVWSGVSTFDTTTNDWGSKGSGYTNVGTNAAPLVSLGVTVIPEPATATLSLLALAGLAARRRRK